MKVIGAGFGRTGTLSLKVALEELGAGPCLHSLESLQLSADPRVSHWLRLVRGEPIDWREALAGWGSTVDWLGACFYREILAAWPDAKVIMSVREPHEWYESCSASLHATRSLAGVAADGSQVLEAVEETIWRGLFDGRFPDREYALAVYDRHRREVTDAVPADRLLIYDIRDGWEPLCEFLGVAAPDTPFPHLNGRRSFWARLGAGAERNGHGPAGASGETRVAPSLLPTAPAAAPLAIAGVAVVDPERSLTQRDVLDLLGLQGDEFAERVFARSGVKRRRLHLDAGLLGHNLQARTPEVERALLAWAIAAVERLNVDLGTVGTVITSSLYSLGCPTLAHRLVEHFEMDPTTDKYHVVGVGCASAVPLVRLGGQALHGHPGRKALIVAADSMSGLLVAAGADDTRSKTVGSAIFGDGCAAMLLDGSEPAAGLQVIATRVHQIPQTLGAVRIEARADDSYLGLVKELPDVAAAHLRVLVDDFLREAGLTGHMVDHWIVHPGGRRIIESAQDALGLSGDDVVVSVDVLADHGNVGTPAIFYVLQQTIARRKPRPGQHGLVVTIGPGVTVGMLLLRW